MRRSMWYALAAILAISAWTAMQGDDADLLAAGKASRQAWRGSHGAAGKLATSRYAAARPAAQADDKDAELWVSQAMLDGVTNWRQRRTLPPLGSVMPVAWASNAPPPPVPVAPPPPPPPPVAPPFPHQWVGRFNDEAASAKAADSSASRPKPAVARAVLTSQDAAWIVQEGDVIEGQWRIERIQGTTMEITYLPLRQRQSIGMK